MNELSAESPATTYAAAVSDAQRLRLLDALRGIALLGILLMNIPGFAMPNYFSESFKSDPASINFWLNAVITVFFEGKMRALFRMVFRRPRGKVMPLRLGGRPRCLCCCL
jgi:uncharacterized protein